MNRRRPDGIDPVARSRARRRALQAVYAWQMSGSSARDVIGQFAHEQAKEQADLEYFEDLVRGVEAHVESLDEALAFHETRVDLFQGYYFGRPQASQLMRRPAGDEAGNGAPH